MKWKFTELPANSKAGCAVEGCKRYADYEAAIEKEFRLAWKVCAYHKLMLQKESEHA